MKNRLKKIRKELKLTQQGLADLTGLSRATIIAIENCEVPPKAETIAKLVKAIGKPANEIFFDFDVV